MPETTSPDPKHDWLSQRELASLLGCSERTASVWAAAGKLSRYEHGVLACGRKKYSRQLVERDVQHRLAEAARRQDEDAGALGRVRSVAPQPTDL